MPRLNTFISNTARHCEQVLAGEFGPLAQAFMGLSDSYHPERHYMRGPGPKWHAKHDAVAARA